MKHRTIRYLIAGALMLIYHAAHTQALDIDGKGVIRGPLDIWDSPDASSISVGLFAGFNSDHTSQRQNAFVGISAGLNNTTGTSNTGLGFQALWLNKVNNSNTAVGTNSLARVRSSGNTAVGSEALRGPGATVGTGGENSAFGYKAGYLNDGGRWNTFVGSQAGRDFQSGDNNVFIGQGCALEHTGGSANVFVGHSAGRVNNNSNNVFIGDEAGRNNGGTGNIFIGYQAGKDITVGSNILWVENSSALTPLVFGDFGMDRVGINCTNPQEALSVVGNVKATGNIDGTAVACSSDMRFKRDVLDLDETLELIKRLRPVSYKWRTESFPERHFNARPQIGFLAQDVEALIPEVVHTSEDGYKSLDYSRLTVILTKAIQSLVEKYETLDLQYKGLERRLADLEQMKK